MRDVFHLIVGIVGIVAEVWIGPNSTFISGFRPLLRHCPSRALLERFRHQYGFHSIISVVWPESC